MRIAHGDAWIDHGLSCFPGLNGSGVPGPAPRLVEMAIPARWGNDCAIGEDQTVIQSSVDPVMGDALLETEAVEKGQIGFTVLGAVDPGRGRQEDRLVPTRNRLEYRIQNLAGVLVLENPALLDQAQLPKPWTQYHLVAVEVLIGALGRQLANLAMDMALDPPIPEKSHRGKLPNQGADIYLGCLVGTQFQDEFEQA